MNARKMVPLYGTDGILDITRKSVSTVRRWELDGIFPKRHKIGPNSVAWFSDELDIWLNSPVDYPSSLLNSHKDS
tara:strand:+ start:322 stop:546 length:225 start_codon:yes stop_codon:yes gene_type:complete